MKKLIFLILLFNLLVYSQNYELNIKLNNGTIVAFSVDDIQRLDFESSTGIGLIENPQLVIESFQVFQNYPNPFNPSTTIVYQIPDASKVRVCVYDINGQLVKELINETQTKGEYQVTWNGKNEKNLAAGSGVYIYAVSSDNNIISRQMILLK